MKKTILISSFIFLSVITNVTFENKIFCSTNTQECTICYNNKENDIFIKLPCCKNNIHKKCMDTWYEESAYKTCPFCKQVLEKNSISPTTEPQNKPRKRWSIKSYIKNFITKKIRDRAEHVAARGVILLSGTYIISYILNRRLYPFSSKFVYKVAAFPAAWYLSQNKILIDGTKHGIRWTFKQVADNL